MTSRSEIVGQLDQVINNDGNIYEGNLTAYLKIIFFNAKNLNLPFHNFRHMMHVTWECYNACIFYQGTLSTREMRNLLIAAMFHDFDHSGRPGDDSANIKLAIGGLQKFIQPQDLPFLKDIAAIIQVTEYPYKGARDTLNLCAQIIRDADISQALNSVWLQQVIFGLAAESNTAPIEILRRQSEFYRSINFISDWAQKRWAKKDIVSKIAETNRLLAILE